MKNIPTQNLTTEYADTICSELISEWDKADTATESADRGSRNREIRHQMQQIQHRVSDHMLAHIIRCVPWMGSSTRDEALCRILERRGKKQP